MKHIVLIGGSYGIGRSLSTMLLAAGHKVTICSRSADDIPSGAHHLTYDVSDEEATLEGISGEVDGFVYCPGSINLKPFSSLKEKDFRADMDINFHGMCRSLKEVMPQLKKGTDPSIVLFSTVAVQVGLAFHTSVAAAKGAIEGFARALAAEMAPTVRVNVIAPSLVDTPLASRIMGNEKMRQNSEQKHPLKRVGAPEDIAAMAEFLLSDRSSWITGQIFGVDGGMGSVKL